MSAPATTLDHVVIAGALADHLGDEDHVVAKALDTATREALLAQGWGEPEWGNPPGWPSDTDVVHARVKTHSQVIMTMAAHVDAEQGSGSQSKSGTITPGPSTGSPRRLRSSSTSSR